MEQYKEKLQQIGVIKLIIRNKPNVSKMTE